MEPHISNKATVSVLYIVGGGRGQLFVNTLANLTGDLARHYLPQQNTSLVWSWAVYEYLYLQIYCYQTWLFFF